MRFEKHVFICTHQREEGTKPCCGEQRGLELVAAMKKAIRDRGLQINIRAQRSGCLDACEHGPSMVVYPEGTWYGGVQLTDVDRIVDQHLAEGNPVKELEITF